MSRHSLLLVLALLCLVWLTTRPSRNLAPFVEDHSLSVILPVIPSTLPSLDELLAPFLFSTTTIYELAIVCPHSLVTDIHHRLPFMLANAAPGHPKVTLYPWFGSMHHYQAALQAVGRIKTQYTLFLDEHGLYQIGECDRAYLLYPRVANLPVGPIGFARSHLNWFQLSPSARDQPAMFLVPPFVVPSSLLAEIPLNSHSSLDWPSIGKYIAEMMSGSFGGIVIGTDHMVACNSTTGSNRTSFHEKLVDNLASTLGPGSIPTSPESFIVLAFPRKEDLRDFTPAACKLRHRGYTVFAYIYDPESSVTSESNCTILYFERSEENPDFADWLTSLGSVPDVVIGLDHRDLVSSTFTSILEQPPFLNTTLMRLPRLQLPYTEWIGTLTLHELRRWNVPEITLSVITNNRSRSLQRLLGSIQRTLFYGDKVNIRINMDQTSDAETIRIVQDFEWYHGDVFLHHRIIHGGLLPAVVESWYPHGDDSYGLLLEDDIELSPLSYAWVKMALLRYKYGNSSPSPKLFGISLYQQKTIELRPTGRQPFDAHTLFQSTQLADPSTPYLSQIPCSWGALYFPSPWREFHDYLSLRLSEVALSLRSVIVPEVRSNKWRKSWKKYFIELVYLRGYVMLYPNYADFVSLSTNHLEVGSHVKDEPEAVYEKKKHLFSLPLMDLSGALAGDAPSPRLLDLPSGALPDWDQLPVLDLLGEVSSMDAIEKRGEERRSGLGDCRGVVPVPSTVRDLLCHVSL